MLFSSMTFLFCFLPAMIIIYYLAPQKIKNLLLLLGSILFYSWGEPVYVVLMIFSAAFNYTMARQMENTLPGKGAAGTLVFAIVTNLLILSFFKYFGFLMDTANGLLGTDIKYTALALPIGISFYTFQALSYIIDVYRGNVKVQKNLINFGLYLSLFPQLIAGPIVKYKDIESQLESRYCTRELFGEGTYRFVLGLGKKVLLANNLGAIYTEVCQLTGDDVSVTTYWIGILAYTLQIYFDFSGYSDMAIGLGKMFGFTFPENFNFPYIAKSVSEFWRRWHISLGSWFREYVYIPLGGNRVSVKRNIINLLIVWSLTGLWHGASWNFVIWGAYYGIILIMEKHIYGQGLGKCPAIVKEVYTMVLVMVGWVFFSNQDLGVAFAYVRTMFGLGGHLFSSTYTLYLIRTSGLLLALGVLLSCPGPGKAFRVLCEKNRLLGTGLILGILILSMAGLIYSSYNPFLYFRF